MHDRNCRRSSTSPLPTCPRASRRSHYRHPVRLHRRPINRRRSASMGPRRAMQRARLPKPGTGVQIWLRCRTRTLRPPRRAVHRARLSRRLGRPRLQSRQAQLGTYPRRAAPPAPPAPRLPLAPRSNDNTASVGAPTSSDRGIAWPNPNTTNPPEFAAPRLVSPSPPPPARTAAAEALPADEPIRGPIPLPRQRPGIFAVAAAAASGPVPLPRVRPADAPAEAPNSAIEPASGYRPGLDSDR